MLLDALDQAYGRHTWHGTNLRGSLRGLDPDQVLWRPAHGRHNIWEETLHAAYWKYAVRNRLLGGKRGAFPLKGSNWFLSPKSAGPKEWKQALALLEETHRALCAAVSKYPARQLGRRMNGSKWSAYDAILGAAFHDIYHAGQIQLLKRLQKAASL
jgi:uncharacterized damage-inducible protein DinB